MAGYTRNGRTRWTQRDVKRLAIMARQNTPVRVMSLTLGRTERAVRSMASLNGVSLRLTNQTRMRVTTQDLPNGKTQIELTEAGRAEASK